MNRRDAVLSRLALASAGMAPNLACSQTRTIFDAMVRYKHDALHTSFDAGKGIALKPDVFFWDIGTGGITSDQMRALRPTEIPIVRFDF